MSQALRVTELWRYPVKSLQGERLDAAMVTGKGLDGDRRYAIFDLDTGLGLTARRVPELLFASASLTADGGVRIALPDGSLADGDDALSAWLERRDRMADIPLRSLSSSHHARAMYARTAAATLAPS
jgi:MOSC domain-containing protein